MCVLLKEGARSTINSATVFLKCNWQREKERTREREKEGERGLQKTNTTGCLGREDAIDRSISQAPTWNLHTIVGAFPNFPRILLR